MLTANPFKTITDSQREVKPDKQSEKCRVPLIKEEDQHLLLARKLAGAAIVEANSILPHAPVYFHKGGRGGKLVTTSFEGVLRVIDPSGLTVLLKNGVGPAKAFGCGLLLARRI